MWVGEFHWEPCGQSFQYQSQYNKHVASRSHITFELSGFMQPVESEEVAIHDEQPLQMHSEDVFHAEQQPTADIDDSSDDVEDVVDNDDDDDPDIVEWGGHPGVVIQGWSSRISREGIATDPAKVDAVKKWPVPTTVQDLQRFWD
eukprot:Em0011g5a